MPKYEVNIHQLKDHLCSIIVDATDEDAAEELALKEADKLDDDKWMPDPTADFEPEVCAVELIELVPVV